MTGELMNNGLTNMNCAIRGLNIFQQMSVLKKE